MFPLSMEELEIYGDRPPVGTDVACRITVEEIQRHRVRVEAEIVRPDGTVWMRIRDWEDWRFHWPGRYRDVFRQPRDYLRRRRAAARRPGPRRGLDRPRRSGSSRPRTWAGPSGATCWNRPSSARRSEPRSWPRPAPSGGGRIDSGGGSPPRRPRGGSGRPRAGPPTYPADLAIVADEHGRPRLIPLGRPDDRSLPAISIAHCDGVAVAIAALDPGRPRGHRRRAAIVDRPEGFLASAFTPGERSLLGRWPGSSRSEWIARFWCAKEAAAKAAGVGLGRRSRPMPKSPRSIEDSGVHARQARARRSWRRLRIDSSIPSASSRPAEPTTPGPGPSEKELNRDVRAFPNRDPRRHHRDPLRPARRSGSRARSTKRPASSPTSAWRRSTPSSSAKRSRNTTIDPCRSTS